MQNYIKNPKTKLKCGFSINVDTILSAVHETNEALEALPETLFKSLDYKTTSSTIGCIFCDALAGKTNNLAIVNPIEKGHPDIVPIEARFCSEEELRNYPVGLEIKCTIGSVPKDTNLAKAEQRIDYTDNVVWQAHHQEVKELLGLTYDYFETESGTKPNISGVFYASNLGKSDWGKISGTTGRNTKVCSMIASGKQKMGKGWVAIVKDNRYITKYEKILKFNR